MLAGDGRLGSTPAVIANGNLRQVCRMPIHDFNQANTVRRAELMGGKSMTRKAGLLKLAMTVAWASVLFASNPASATQDFAPSLKRLSSEQPYGLSPYPLVTTNQGNESPQEGIDVRPDAAEAARSYRKAAEQGYAGAQNNLGLLYESGQGVEQDFAEAVKWYCKAAKQEVAEAQFNLAVAYAKGQGTAPDLIQAHFWFNLAAKEGLVDAIPLREFVAKSMTPAQVSDAKLRANRWLAQHRMTQQGQTNLRGRGDARQ